MGRMAGMMAGLLMVGGMIAERAEAGGWGRRQSGGPAPSGAPRGGQVGQAIRIASRVPGVLGLPSIPGTQIKGLPRVPGMPGLPGVGSIPGLIGRLR